MPDRAGDSGEDGAGIAGDGPRASAPDGQPEDPGGEEARAKGAVPGNPSTEDLVAAYEAAGKDEKRLVRSLIKAGHGQEAKRLTEILHYFPGTRLKS